METLPVKITKKVNSDCTFDIPNGMMVTSVVFENETANAAVLDIGYTAGTDNIMTEGAIEPSSVLCGVTVFVINALLKKHNGNAHSVRGTTPLYIGAFAAGSSWNSAVIKITVNLIEY